MTSRRKPKRPLNQYAGFSGILFQMITIIGLGTLIGIKLDEWYPNKNDIYTVTLATLAVVLSIYIAIKQIIKLSKEDE
ncbi:MAG: AtpZ/AtpI family protein [Bacteroidota bacterium]